jgi:DNA-binding ferritin-like protein
LYKEDFEKFSQGLEEIIQYIREKAPAAQEKSSKDTAPTFSDVNFEEL